MSVSISPISAREFVVLAPKLVDLYLSAMGYDPAIRDGRIAFWRRDATQPGFCAVIALADPEPGTDADGDPLVRPLVGLAYGFVGTPENWWHRQVSHGLRQRGQDPDLGAYFELAEIHVAPSRQGAGIGRRLISELLDLAPMSRVLLSTPEVAGEDNHAFHLYRSFGFTDLLRDFYYTGDSRPFAVLRLDRKVD